MKSNRRHFLQSTLAGSSLLMLPKTPSFASISPDKLVLVEDSNFQTYGKSLDLSPAKWIWLPSGRTLHNTFLFFRKTFSLTEIPTKATGWILGESRYKLYLNSQRIQWGPAPFDPRWSEADPIDFTNKLTLGENVIGSEVLYYGFGDGTMPIGKPGFIFYLQLEYASGKKETIVSDTTWQVKVASAWKPGQYKRWYLRSLQEEFDARLYPTDWNTLKPKDSAWLNAAEIAGAAANKPIIASWARDYLYDSGGGNIKEAELRQRSVRMLKENKVGIQKLSEEMYLKWKVSTDEYFQFNMPDDISYDIIREKVSVQSTDNQYVVNPKSGHTAVMTFEFESQSVGFPYFTIEAPEGTIVELLVHEGHEINGKYALINTHFNSWTKFICKEGKNTFEVFDYESVKWLQLHVRNTEKSVKISNIGIRRREYPFTNPPQLKCSDRKLEKLFSACLNTIYNNTQETIVDGMARERQQYSGDLGHMVHAIFRGFGEVPILARFLNTYSQGITEAGFFLDTWPAYDRLCRLTEREIGITNWGPLLDHGVGFNFDCMYYYQYTADKSALKEVYPRLKKFFYYLKNLQKPEGTMPVEDLGIPTVWIDHTAYKSQKHKECAFSLYVSAMCLRALPMLAEAMNDANFAKEVTLFGNKVLAATQKKFWDNTLQTWVCNKPWQQAEGEIRHCDRTLGMGVLYELNPNKQDNNSVKILAEKPSNLGISYVTNAIWRFWALAKGGRMDVILNEFRNDWYNSPSVQKNNTMAEWIEVRPDSNDQWSHASISPMFSAYMDMAGIKPLKVGYSEVEISPQLGDLANLSLTNYTIQGGIEVDFTQKNGKLEAKINLPKNVTGWLVWKGKRMALKTGRNELVV